MKQGLIFDTHLPCRPPSLDIFIVIAIDRSQSFYLQLVDFVVIGCSFCGGCQGKVVGGGLLLFAGRLLPLFGRHRGAWREVALHPDLVAQHEELKGCSCRSIEWRWERIEDGNFSYEEEEEQAVRYEGRLSIASIVESALYVVTPCWLAIFVF